MGTKPVFKRHKNGFYVTCCFVIGLFLSGCQHFTLPASIDTDEEKYLTMTQAFVLNEDYASAVKESQRILEYYSRMPETKDVILSNYVQTSRIISFLLTRILDDIEKKLALHQEILAYEKQMDTLVVSEKSLIKKTEAQNNKLAVLSLKIKALEDEKKLLQNQIQRLKEIDLNSDKTMGKPGQEGSKAEESRPKNGDDL
ncbi:MAG: hypothetical protein NDI81_03000 [Desulfobacula sp.]|nr:hypothetical protein [Desulfobacula sp.]